MGGRQRLAVGVRGGGGAGDEARLHDAAERKAFTIWFSMAPLRELPDMAFSVQSEIYLAAYVPWEDAADDSRCEAWLADVMADLGPVTVGQYLGDSDLRRRPHRFLSEEAWERLGQVYADRDPDRLFVGYLT